MARVEEGFFDRREIVGDSADVPYLVFEAADEAEVKAACEGEEGIPDWIGDLKRKEVEIEERVNATTWRVLARFQKPTWSWPGGTTPDSRFAFDTGGGTQHITQSIATVGSYGPKRTSTPKGVIGYDGKNVQGVDITLPVFNFTETHYFTDDEITQAYKLTLFGMTGKYNDAAFRGFSAGEVLFLGASGSRQGDDANDLWEVTFRFAASPNRTGLTVGDITGIDKLGWHYLDIQYEDAEHTAPDGKKILLADPVAVYVHKVYYNAAFSALGIGVD